MLSQQAAGLCHLTFNGQMLEPCPSSHLNLGKEVHFPYFCSNWCQLCCVNRSEKLHSDSLSPNLSGTIRHTWRTSWFLPRPPRMCSRCTSAHTLRDQSPHSYLEWFENTRLMINSTVTMQYSTITVPILQNIKTKCAFKIFITCMSLYMIML